MYLRLGRLDTITCLTASVALNRDSISDGGREEGERNGRPDLAWSPAGSRRAVVGAVNPST